MKRLLAFLIVFLLFLLMVENIVGLIFRLQIEPFETFEREKLLFRGRLYGRSNVDARRPD